MQWWLFLLAFLPPILFAVGNLWESQISNGVFKYWKSSKFYSAATNMLVIPLLFLFGDGPRMAWSAGIMLAAGYVAIQMCWSWLYFYALRRIDVSTGQAVWSLGSAVVPVSAATLFGEAVGVGLALGFFLVLAASIIMCVDDFKRPRLGVGFFMMLAVSLMYYGGIMVGKQALQSMSWPSFFFWILIAEFLVSMTFLIPKKWRAGIVGDFAQYKKNFAMFFGYEFMQFGLFAVFLFLLATIPVVVKEGVANTQPLFNLAFACLLARFGLKGRIREDLARGAVLRKVVCIFAMIAGCMMMVL
ncbi:MAG: hypothetical protein LBL46_03025 [Rickettsiales bacterium]|jgi:drug/metabolite transporter (DMT)-like permease|nr:hypothetical protein [Rickettsiales bacterium]